MSTLMRTVEQIQTRIKEIENDDRYKSGRKHPATLDENAPLAMIQLALETEIATLRWVLK